MAGGGSWPWQRGRIFVVVDQRLYALDAANGRPVPDFGERGRIDLRQGLGRDVQGLTVTARTPGVVYKNILVMGSKVSEGLPAAPGHIRGYDVRTGKLVWKFNTIPQPGEYGYETWPPDAWMYIGAANSWAGLSVDTERGLVFAPTGSAAYDFYGGNRTGNNLFANCLIALKADTGERVWHFQFVRHDIWDRDLSTPPILIRKGENVQPRPLLILLRQLPSTRLERRPAQLSCPDRSTGALDRRADGEDCQFGTGLMPGCAHLGKKVVEALSGYLLYGENKAVDATTLPRLVVESPYSLDGYRRFLDPDGYPAVKPPWGTLTAINMETGEFVWQIPFGEIPELAAQGLRNTGSENYGGPVVTAGGLLFIGATNYDNKFRAFDKITGKLLWQATLPAAGNATPAVYEVNGRQFVVIAAGGGKSGRPSGGRYVAFALPE